MAIKRPQQPTSNQVDEWVNTRGGKFSAEENFQKQEKPFTMFMPVSTHRELKAFCAANGISIKSFILEAIAEKLSK